MKTRIYLPLLALAILAACCKPKEKPAPLPDCTGKERVSAMFDAYMGLGDERFGEITDTIFLDRDLEDTSKPAQKTIYFMARNAKASSYKFDNAFKEFRYNPKTIRPGVNEVTLSITVADTIDKQCFPDDPGINTVTRTFPVVFRKHHPLEGEYEGYDSDNPTVNYRIQIAYHEEYVSIPQADNNYITLCIYNLSNGYKVWYPFDYMVSDGFTNTMFCLDWLSQYTQYDGPGFIYNGLKGTGKLNPKTDSLVITYKLATNQAAYDKVFRGKKIR